MIVPGWRRTTSSLNAHRQVALPATGTRTISTCSRAVKLSAETRGRLLNLQIYGRCFPAVLFDLIFNLLPFVERAQSSALDRGDVDEYVFAASLRLDKSIALGWIEPLRGAARHFDLPGHDPG